MDFSYEDHQRNGCSQMPVQSVNGPNIFDEAHKYFEFPVEERLSISGDHFYGLSPNAQGVPANLPHLFHLSPQGYSTQPIYHSHSQNALPALAIAATPHQAPHMMQTVNYLAAPHGPYTPSSPHHYSHERIDHRPHPNPTFNSALHSQAQAQLQSIEEIKSRWVALQAIAVTWPPGAIEPLDSTGESPLMVFVDRVERKYKYQCRVPVEGKLCDKKNLKKERILSHIRKDHLHFRPLACGGQCGFGGCQQRFPSKSAWTDHVHPRKAICVCGKEMYAQNLREHQTRACPRRFG